MTTKRKPGHRSQDRRHKRKNCIDCVDEGITTGRKAPHPGPRCATHHRAIRANRRSSTQEQRWMQVYGISGDEYWAIYRYQMGRCFICQRATGVRRKLSVDHCHKTGVVRGLLCSTCNSKILGHARDEIAFFERCIDYLTDPPAVRVIGERITPDMQT